MRTFKLIASGLGTGYAPFAPGTAGSILGVFIFYIFHFILNKYNWAVSPVFILNLVAIVIVLVLGVWSIKEVHKIWIHDAPEIVIDEIVGVWITLLLIPFQWQYYLLGLAVFRFFDIAKPLGIRKLDNQQSDWSVMLDDVLAGVYGFIVMQLIIHFITT